MTTLTGPKDRTQEHSHVKIVITIFLNLIEIVIRFISLT